MILVGEGLKLPKKDGTRTISYTFPRKMCTCAPLAMKGGAPQPPRYAKPYDN